MIPLIPRHFVYLVMLAVVTMLPGPNAFAGEPIPLTACGQEVAGGTYYLTGDLDCTGQPGHGIFMRGKGRLELRGFALSNAQLDGVECYRCDVVGPGAILNAVGIGIRPARKGRITNVTVTGSGSVGVDGGRLRITDSRIEDNKWGIIAGGNARLTNTIVTGNERSGVEGPYLSSDGCARGRIFLKSSEVSGNGTSPDCGVLPDDCADVISCREPRVSSDSTCGTSFMEPAGPTWGVCSLD
ncbi:MAG: right-handed parallel beta-helix repeat-containing protein [Candidatus Binatia bacterium]